MKEHKVPVQSLIDHIKTAVDVDPWAKEMAEELLKEQDDLGAELTNAVELIHKKNERIKELLKEQEAKPIAYTDNPYTGLPVAKCPNCGKFARQFHMAHPGEETHFCPWCGQAVKWE